MLNILGIVLVASIAIGLIVIFYFSRSLSNPLHIMAERFENMANGDLTANEIRVKNNEIRVKNKDEIGDLADSFNRMTFQLKDTVQQVSNVSLRVAGTSKELSASSEETSRMVENVAESIQQLAIGAEEQVDKASVANNAAISISKELGQLTVYIQQVDNTAQDAAKMAEQGKDVIQHVIEHMHTIKDETQSTVKTVNVLEEKSKEIGKIVSIITNVAKQTNLLALNAAIEAARAGDHGKGFAVVADEVRKLAEQSGSAANQVNKIIVEIQSEIKESVEAIGQELVSTNEGIQLVDSAGQSFMNIKEGIDNLSKQIGEVTGIIQGVTAKSEIVANETNETSKIVEKAASYTQSITAVVEEQAASIEEVASASDTLADMAQDLQGSIKLFKL